MLIQKQINDFDRLVEIYPHWQGRIKQLSRGSFKGTLSAARTSNLQVTLLEANNVIHLQGREQLPMMFVAPVTSRNAGSRWQGRNLEPGSIVIRGKDVETDHCCMKGAINQHFMLLESHFRQAMIQEAGEDHGPMGWQAIQTSPALFNQLDKVFHRYFSHAAGSTEMESNLLEESCIRALIEAIFPAIQLQQNSGLVPAQRAQLVKRVEEYLIQFMQQSITESTLCQEFHVRGRTLRLAFREVYGMGPIVYLQNLRLHAARTLLKRSPWHEVSVADIARRVGFQHHGRFSSYYLRTFGELPSATLKS